MTDAPNLDIIAFGDGRGKLVGAPSQIGHHGLIDLADPRLRHELPELHQRHTANDRRLGTGSKSCLRGRTGLMSGQVAQSFDFKGLEQESICCGSNLVWRVATAENDNARAAPGAQL